MKRPQTAEKPCGFPCECDTASDLEQHFFRAQTNYTLHQSWRARPMRPGPDHQPMARGRRAGLGRTEKFRPIKTQHPLNTLLSSLPKLWSPTSVHGPVFFPSSFARGLARAGWPRCPGRILEGPCRAVPRSPWVGSGRAGPPDLGTRPPLRCTRCPA